jgi:hypothetical protein
MNQTVRPVAVLIALLSAATGFAQIVAYEADSGFPENAMPSWTRFGTFDADRWFENGSFLQYVELGAWAPPPYGELDGYRRTISEFTSVPAFFLEWSVVTNAPSADISGGPVVMSAWGNGPALYHFSITDGLVRFSLGNPTQATLFVPVVGGTPHTYRIEVHNSIDYTWYIDGRVIDWGTSAGPYPTASSRLSWSSQYYYHDHTAAWNYIRYGVIPRPGSGDYDSNGVIDATDAYFFLDCLLGPDADGPGCRWADLNGDGKVNGDDIQPFAAAMMAG